MYRDLELACHIWKTIFPLALAQLPSEDHTRLGTAVTSLLSKVPIFPFFPFRNHSFLANRRMQEYHGWQRGQDPDTIRIFLETLCRCGSKAVDLIPGELLKYLGKAHNAWHAAQSLLEASPRILLSVSDATSNRDSWERAQDALAELYQLMGEEDLLYGLWQRRCSIDHSRAGLLLEQQGMWQRAQDVFYNAMTRGQSGLLSGVGRWEMALWEDHWIHCAKHLQSWELLTEFARTHGHTELALDSAWKISEWGALREALLRYSQGNESPQLRIYQSYMAVQEGRSQDVETLCNQAIHLFLLQWQALPTLPSPAHIPLLQGFQQVVELKESAQIIKEINGTNRHQVYTHSFSCLSEFSF